MSWIVVFYSDVCPFPHYPYGPKYVICSILHDRELPNIEDEVCCEKNCPCKEEEKT
jgi:hypothetical protein